MTQRIAVIPGDGIGTEVVAAARTVLDAACRRHATELSYDEYDCVPDHVSRCGSRAPVPAISAAPPTPAR